MPEMTTAQLKQRIAEMEAAEAARKEANNKISFKIGDKGGLSVYHGSRFPTTLYYSQWLKVLTHADEILTYLEAHKAQLAHKENE